jgi:predicted lipoprotein
MLTHIGTTIILPLHQTLVAQAEALDERAAELKAQPSLETLLAAQAQWRITMTNWRQASLFALGRQTLVLHSAIESPVPPNVAYIETLIADPSIVLDAAFLQTQGSNVAGLGVVEYLLFGLDTTPEAQVALLSGGDGARRLDYLTAVTGMLRRAAGDLLNYWQPENGDGYLQAFIEQDDPFNVRESINMLVNALIAGTELMVHQDIAVPLGLQIGRPSPNLVRTPYSDYTLDLMRTTLEMVRLVFTGGGDAEADPGLNAFLDASGAARDGVPLSQIITDEIDVIIADINRIDAPLRQIVTGDQTPLLALYQDMRALYLMMKTDMISQLGLTITFSGSDGD